MLRVFILPAVLVLVCEAIDQFQLQYLKQFGYVATDSEVPLAINNIRNIVMDTDGGPDELTTVPSESIKKLQLYAGVNQTGEFDEPTVRMLMTPRCQNPDIIDPSNRLSQYFLTAGEEEEEEEPAAAILIPLGPRIRGKRQTTQDERKWQETLDLTFAFESVTSQNPAAREVINSAFQAWAECSKLSFKMVDMEDEPHIQIRFASSLHEPPARDEFDGRGGVLAHAWYPPIGLAHFDEDEDWTDSCYMYAVALHEIGHLLGLDHEPRRASIMFAYFDAADVVNSCDKDNVRHLAESDIANVRAKYGSMSCDKVPDVTLPPPEPRTTLLTLDPGQLELTTVPPTTSGGGSTSPAEGSTSNSVSGSFPYVTTQGQKPWRRECGDLEDNFILSSPYYPDYYPNGMNCEWEVQVPDDMRRVTVHFIAFELEEGGGECVSDVLKLVYNDTQGEEQTMKLCGTQEKQIPIETNLLKIEFKSDYLKQEKGFRMLFTFDEGPSNTECYKEFDEGSGEIIYDSTSSEEKSCTYHITTNDPEKNILLVFSKLVASSCDQFELLTDESDEWSLVTCEELLLDRYELKHFISPGQSFYIRFNSGDEALYFVLVYRAVNAGAENCGGRTGPNFNLTNGASWTPPNTQRYSPFAVTYIPHTDCVIAVSAGGDEKEMRVMLTEMYLEKDKLCSYDFVEVYTVEEGRERFCGINEKITMKTAHNFLVHFHTDGTIEPSPGFRLEYGYPSCGLVINNATGTVEVGEHMPGGYPQGSTCKYTFQSPNRYFVCFDRLHLPLHGKRKCRGSDYIEHVSPHYGGSTRHCKRNASLVLEPGDVLKFQSGKGAVKMNEGYKFNYFILGTFAQPSWSRYSVDCFAEIGVTARSQNTKYEFTLYSGEPARCLWKFSSNDDTRLHLSVHFEKIRMKSGDCTAEYVRVHDPRAGCQEYGTLCRKSRSSIFDVPNNEVYVYFQMTTRKSTMRLYVRQYEPTKETHTSLPTASGAYEIYTESTEGPGEFVDLLPMPRLS